MANPQGNVPPNRLKPGGGVSADDIARHKYGTAAVRGSVSAPVPGNGASASQGGAGGPGNPNPRKRNATVSGGPRGSGNGTRANDY